MAERKDFELAFRLLIGHEGVYSSDRNDRGNWTSGVIGQGQLKGTKYGIAAHAYPHLDIRNLSLQDAHDIYFADYWAKSGCTALLPRVAFCLFDAAVNNGVSRAVKWLQTVVGVAQDGVFGNVTRRGVDQALVKDPSGVDLIVEFHSHRLRFMAELDSWRTFRGGWSRRLVRVPMEAVSYWPV